MGDILKIAIPIIVTGVTIYAGPIKEFIAAHPDIMGILNGLSVILAILISRPSFMDKGDK